MSRAHFDVTVRDAAMAHLDLREHHLDRGGRDFGRDQRVARPAVENADPAAPGRSGIARGHVALAPARVGER